MGAVEAIRSVSLKRLKKRTKKLGFPDARRHLGYYICLAVTVAIFVIDIALEASMAAPVLYVGVIWLASRLKSENHLFQFAILCSVLTLADWVWTTRSTGSVSTDVIFNETLSLFVIWLSAMALYREKKAVAQSLRLSWIADRTPSAMFMSNTAGEIEWTNQAFCSFIGAPWFRVRGTNISDYLDGIDLDTIFQKNQKKANSPSEICQEFPFQNAHGEVEWLEIRLQTVFDISGQPAGFFGIGTNVSVLKKQLYDLEATNNDLKQFAYVASHDLQEPLRKIVCYLQILDEDHGALLNDDAKECLEYAVDGSKRMQRLIEDLLRFSGLKTRKALEFCVLNVNDVLEELVSELADEIDETKANIHFENLPTLRADRGLIMQLFKNLIENALKYRDKERKPEIDISAQKTPHGWKFCVSDNGIGISENYAQRIFLMFQRLHKQSEYPGTGIGLAICKKIIEKHRGYIWVESGVGEGSKFYFTLPESRIGGNV